MPAPRVLPVLVAACLAAVPGSGAAAHPAASRPAVAAPATAAAHPAAASLPTTTTSRSVAPAAPRSAARSVSATRRYDGDAALRYALRYTRNGDTTGRAWNRRYTPYPWGDCTNLVSQSLLAGGLRTSRTWRPGSATWLSAPRLYAELRRRGYRVNVMTGTRLGGRYTSARPGDVYFFDWGLGYGMSHTAVASTSGQSGHLDVKARWFPHGHASRIVQHTVDRTDAPWNLGYRAAEPWGLNRAKMKVWLVHLS